VEAGTAPGFFFCGLIATAREIPRRRSPRGTTPGHGYQKPW
jgi:hypothetical protein